MTFARLHRGQWIAFVAALALLLVLPLKWYSTHQAEQDRRFQQQFSPRLNLEETPSPSTQAGQAAAALEKNAWQANAPIDRLLLLAMLSAAALALVAAFMRAAGRTPARISPSMLATAVAILAAALIVYRIAQPPGGVAGVVKPGAVFGLLAVLGLAFGSHLATFRDSGAGQADRAPAVSPDPIV